MKKDIKRREMARSTAMKKYMTSELKIYKPVEFKSKRILPVI